MQTLGSIEYNALGSNFKEIYPQLASGYIRFTFRTDSDSYTMLIYYNIIAEALYFNIYNSKNEALQIGYLLTESPVNLLIADELKDYALYVKDFVVYFGDKDEMV